MVNYIILKHNNTGERIYTFQDTDHVIANHADVLALIAQLALKADINSPTFTGTPQAPTPSAGNNSNNVATTAFVATAIAALVNSSPSTLDTLNELAAALGNDANFSTTIITLIGTKAPIASPTFTGTPQAPTQTAGNNTSAIATTAFVTNALATVPGYPAPIIGQYLSGNRIYTSVGSSNYSATAILNYVFAVPVRFTTNTPITDIGMQTNVGAGGNIRFGIFSHDSAGFKPKTKLSDEGSIPAATQGFKSLHLNTPITPTPGEILWLVWTGDANLKVPTIPNVSCGNELLGFTPISNVYIPNVYLISASAVTNAFSSGFPSDLSTTTFNVQYSSNAAVFPLYKH